MASKHFGHVTCYVADVGSGLLRSKVGKNFYAIKISTVRTEPALLCIYDISHSQDVYDVTSHYTVLCKYDVLRDMVQQKM